MFIHRNSLQYRIDKFIERTAIDIRQFEEAAAVYLMMHLF
ncbi:Fis-type helix-turn-helix domain protein [Bacillus paralicheniformis]|nr:Fis-type helix-turn-helix domain protein [Bacillus paralicheniformis]